MLQELFLDMLEEIQDTQSTGQCRHGVKLYDRKNECPVCFEEALIKFARKARHDPTLFKQANVEDNKLPSDCAVRNCEVTFVAIGKGRGFRVYHNDEEALFIHVQPPLTAGAWDPALLKWFDRLHLHSAIYERQDGPV